MSEQTPRRSGIRPARQPRRVGRLPPGALSPAAGEVDVPRLRRQRPPGRPRVLPAQPSPSDPRLRPGEEAASTSPRTRRTMGIWEAMEFLNTLVDDSDPDTDLIADRAPDADRRGDPGRRASALVHPDRPDPRPGQDPLPLRRAAMGGRRRHVPRRLPLLRQDRLPRVLPRTTPTRASPEYQTPMRHLRAEAAGSTASTCPGATTSTSTTSSRTTSPTRAWR